MMVLNARYPWRIAMNDDARKTLSCQRFRAAVFRQGTVFLIAGMILMAGAICHAGEWFVVPFSPRICGDFWQDDATRSDAPARDEVSFQRDILPLLADRCFTCHGPDEGANVSGLRLDRRDDAIGELPSGDGRAIVPGRPNRSALIQRITSKDPDWVMPPPSSHRKPLTEEEVATLAAWITAGANYERHWSFEPLPAHIELPRDAADDWSRNEIDRFISAAWKEKGLKPAREAERWQWLRRVSFDLTGLPPALEELDEFEQDQSADAYERVVDRLLASPGYGEHFATLWLDLARYADSYGYQSDLLCEVWPYRDWVVRALNQNMPYDQFIREQLAGDLLPNPTTDQIIATAFNRLHRQTNEGGSIDLEWRIEYASDRVHTFGTAFLGLTLECARCHDHKFDPISQKEYYQLTAFFNSIDEAGTYNDAVHIPTPTLLLPTDHQRHELAAIDEELAAARENHRRALAEARREYAASQPVIPVAIPNAWASFSLDQRGEDHRYADSLKPDRAATTSAANQPIAGRFGLAVQLTGDDALNVPSFELRPWQPFSICCWIWLPDHVRNALLWHQTTGTDTGFSGTELTLVEGRLRLAMNRFWPGNSLAIESEQCLPTGRWVFVAATYDGLGRAEGMTLYIDGVPSRMILRDHLYKTPSAGQQMGFGERFRTRGPQGGAIDQIDLHDCCLSPLEILAMRGEADPVLDHAEGNATWRQEHYLHRVHGGVQQTAAQIRGVIARRFALLDQIQELMVMRENDIPTETYVLERGAYDAPRTPDKRVERDTPAVFPLFPSGAPRNRRGLAEWLIDPHHPLTARVAVNRVWQNFFGVGLVETAEDFGVQGARPTHPELLDWLARDFVNHGWDHKRLCRQIALSATYRQASQVDVETRRRDPTNRWLARGPAHRLSAEALRDMALWTAGLLHEKIGGPPVSPYQPDGLWTENNSFSPPYRQSSPPDLYRRSLYSVRKRTAPLPNMMAFDAVSRETCVARRSVTHTPMQALVLLNDPQFVEAAVATARRALDQDVEGDAQRIAWMFRLVTSRLPNHRETEVLLRLIQQQRDLFGQNVEAARAVVGGVERESNDSFTAEATTEWAAWTAAAQVVLNSDAASWKR